MAARDLIVRILGDDKSLQSALLRDSAAMDKFGTKTTGSLAKVDSAFSRTQKLAAGGFVGGIAATAAISAIKTSTDAASDLNEQITKNQQVFGDSADAIREWSTTTSTSLGISQTAALEATGTFGNLFRAIGIGGPQAADTSKKLTQLASDLASFNNADPSDVLLAIRSGLIGEAEPLRKFGVLLSEARVQQLAMAQTGKTSAKALTDQEKAAARVSIIFKDTAAAQGDFARTSSGLANQQRILSAEVKDLEANLGSLLLPTVKNVTAGLVEASDTALELVGALKKLGSVKIPEIHIPLVTDIGGGTVGGAVGKAAGEGIKTAVKVQFLGIGLAAASIARKAFADGAEKGSEQPLPKDLFKFKLPQQEPPDLKPATDFDKLPGVNFHVFGDTIIGAITKATAAAKSKVAEALKKGRAAIAKEAAATAKENQRDAFANLIDALSLKVDTAAATKGFADDLSANTKLQNAIKAQIKIEGNTTALASQLFQARQDRAAIIGQQAAATKAANEKAAAAAKAAVQAAQFRALGLDAEGGKAPPTIANLKKQLQQLSSRDDLTGNQKGLLSRIRKVLVDPINQAKEPTRAAIKELFDTIRGEFDKGAKDVAKPITKGSGLNTKAFLQGLGLDPEQIRQLRSRLSGVNSSGVALAGTPNRPTGSFAAQTPVVVESHTNLYLDGDQVSRTVTKSQQVTKRRNPKQKRGPNRNG